MSVIIEGMFSDEAYFYVFQYYVVLLGIVLTNWKDSVFYPV